MVKDIDLNAILYDKKPNYAAVRAKFNRRFPIERADRLLDSINNKYVDRFVFTLFVSNKYDYLDNFYSNLSNSIIIKNRLLQKIFLSNNNYGGHCLSRHNSYLILGNDKDLEKNHATLTPYHELFHLLTTRFDSDNDVRIGFQYNDFGKALNEGYTEIMTRRYFGYLNENDCNTCLHFTWFAEMVEDIIGKDKMEYYYLKSDIEGLILELEKYLPREKVINMIKSMDKMFNNEEKLFEYQKDILDKKQSIDMDRIKQYYSVNNSYRTLIYSSIKEINKNKELKLKTQNSFNEKNDKKKLEFDNEDNVYIEYYEEEVNNLSKKGGMKKCRK